MNSPITSNAKNVIALSSFVLIMALSGCAEGPLWRAGKLTPWVRNQWAEEEKIANSIFTRKDEMNRMVAIAEKGTLEQKQKAAEDLASVFDRDPILLMRLHAVKLLGKLNCPESIDTLAEASKDHDADVRIAAIQSWSKMPADVAIGQLHEIIGSDTNIDVRLAATRALGNYQGLQTVEALSLALADSDPALQVRATESLGRATGESIGRDVQAWQRYIQQAIPDRENTESPFASGNKERVVENNSDSIIR